MSLLHKNTKIKEGTDADLIGTGIPSGNVGIQPDTEQVGFFVYTSAPHTIWFKDSSGTWAIHKAFGASDIIEEGIGYAWGDNEAVFFQVSGAGDEVFLFPRNHSILVDGDVADSNNSANTLVTTGLPSVSVQKTVDISGKSINDLNTKLYSRPVTAPGGYDEPVQDSVMFYDEDSIDGNHWKYRTGKSLVKDALSIDNNSDGNFLKWHNSSDSFIWTTPSSIDGSFEIASTDANETAFKVSIPGQDNMFCIDASSSYDNETRITIKTTNDFESSDVPYLGNPRGLLHIEREANDNLPAFSVWSHGGSATDTSGINLLTWNTQNNTGSYIHLISNSGTFPGGYVLDTKVLGQIGFGGYTNNQHRISAFVEAKATENWSYSNRLGSKLVFKTCEKGGNTIAEHLTVSSEGVFAHAPSSAPDTLGMKNSAVTMHVDESQDKLTFTVKYSDGTVKTGTVDLS